jgi:hypothetical protein
MEKRSSLFIPPSRQKRFMTSIQEIRRGDDICDGRRLRRLSTSQEQADADQGPTL